MNRAVLGQHVLVLDAGYQPVNIVSARRALVLLVSGRAVAVEDSGLVVRSAAAEWRLPRIIRLFIAIAHRVYRVVRVQLNRRNLYARDRFACQYCGSLVGPFTIDHVVPRSRRTLEFPRGGTTSWDNCVTCCVACNHHKGNRLPSEAGMRLLAQPREPRWLPPLLFRRFLGDAMHQSWEAYLYQR